MARKMTFKMARHSVFAFLALLILPAVAPKLASGQDIPSPYQFMERKQEASIYVGYDNKGTGRFGFGPKSGPVAGARYGIRLGGPFALEGVAGYHPTTRDIVDPSRDEGNMVIGEADAGLLSLDARVRFSLTGDRTWKGLHPYVFFGAGVAFDLVGETEEDGLLLPEDQFKFGTKLIAPFGTGVRWLLADRFVLRADFSLTLYQLKTPPGFADPERALTGVGEKEWANGSGFSMGLGIRF